MRPGEHWPQTERVWRQFAQMDLVMERLDIDPVLAVRKSGGAAMAKARDTCLACFSHQRCRRWLEQDGDPRGVLEFCPNAVFLEELSRIAPMT